MRFGTDGVRGVANAELTVELSLALGRAAARVLGGERIVVGRDTRRSGSMLAAAVAAGIAAEGVDVVDGGVLPTPAVAAIAAEESIPGAVVSASHNPFEDNGIKLFAPGGLKLDDVTQEAVESEIERVRSGHGADAPTGDGVGRIVGSPDLAGRYLAKVTGALEGRSLAGLRVVVDLANGAATAVAPRAFEAAGATVVAMSDAPDGQNINAGCGSTELAPLAARTRAEGADLGIAFDGDADRALAVDADGQVVDGDQLLAISALDLRARGRLRGDAVAVTVMANLGFRRAMERAGIGVVETPVGDRHVLAALDRHGLSLGGEQSGHLIYRDLATTGDGLLSALLVADVVVRSGRTLAELAAAAMTRLPQVLVNVAVDGDPAVVVDGLADLVAAHGARLGSDGRVLVRASGTEPLVRVMVEATDAAVAESTAAALADAATGA